jgi:hypothetical protein
MAARMTFPQLKLGVSRQLRSSENERRRIFGAGGPNANFAMLGADGALASPAAPGERSTAHAAAAQSGDWLRSDLPPAPERRGGAGGRGARHLEAPTPFSAKTGCLRAAIRVLVWIEREEPTLPPRLSRTRSPPVWHGLSKARVTEPPVSSFYRSARSPCAGLQFRRSAGRFNAPTSRRQERPCRTLIVLRISVPFGARTCVWRDSLTRNRLITYAKDFE